MISVESGETTWDKPDALKTDDELAQRGDWVWMPDPDECFIPARIISSNAKSITLESETGYQHTVKANTQLEHFSLAHLQRVVSDLVLLDSMSAPLILHNLRKRFEEKHEIYTAIGTILISINPYQGLPLYTPEMINKYAHQGVKDLPPHVFGITANALKGVTDFGVNQSIVISGESGAGKTEATKQCLSFLAAVCNSLENVEQKILLSNPILESFGNAKTVRNDNSSRFGKYIEIYLKQGQLCGAHISNYLLEKIRVVSQARDERDFHIFYQLTEGCRDQALKQRFGIGSAKHYHYLKISGCTQVASIDDSFDWAETQRAMKSLNFSAQNESDIIQTVMVVLNLGNIAFSKAGDRKCNIKDNRPIEAVSRLMQVDPALLSKVMQIRTLKIRGQSSTDVPLGVDQANENRDALAKFIYNKLFDWLVVKINTAMQLPSNIQRSALKTIGILDIFGFEIFQVNSFEQLCINFTNEKLQQLFNQTTFKLEEEVYRNEGIKFKHIDFIDNQIVLDLIEKAPTGLLCLLDEELRVPQGSDPNFLSKAINHHQASPNFARCLQAVDHFTVTHYAGAVVYDVKGFLEKNRDTLTEDLLDLCRSSRFPFLNELLGPEISTADRKASLGKVFRGQLYTLSNALHQTEPHYIRTIKPNHDKAPFVFVPVTCYEQLTYSGVFEAVRIRRLGYPFRLQHQVFIDRYSCITKQNLSGGVKDKCVAIIREQKLDMGDVQVGRSMVLYRAPIQRALELKRSIIIVQKEMEEALQRLCRQDPNTLPDPEHYFEELAKWVMKANEFNLKTPNAERARTLLFDYIESRIDPQLRQLLEEAKAAVNQEMLEYAVGEAARTDYDTNLIRECKILYHRVCRINEESAIAVDTLEERHMEVCLNAAAEIGMGTETLEYFDQLFNRTEKETFIKEQMRAAVRLGDHAREIRLTVRLKAVYLQRTGADFNLPKYFKMKLPEYWASEKWLGLSFKKDEMMAGMFFHSSHAIHSSLLELPNSKLEKLACEMFKKIQIYMGDRTDPKEQPQSAITTVLDTGIKTPEIRDELYAQVIKQLQRNNTSREKGWDMMGLLLITFPPQRDFENYVEVFFRENLQADQLDAYIGGLQSILYNGARHSVPSPQEMGDVRNTLWSLCDAFAEPLPTGVPTYQDLLDPYLGLTEDQMIYVRKTPKGRVKKQRSAQPVRRATLSKPKPIARQAGVSNRGRGQAHPSNQGNRPQPKPKPAVQKRPPPKKKPEPVRNPWKEYVDDASGCKYYYNEDTGESSWEPPPEIAYAETCAHTRSASRGGWA